MSESKEIQTMRVEPREIVFSQIVDPMAAMEQMGLVLYRSGMFGCGNADQGKLLALACMCERRNPVEMSRTYHIIEGRLSMRADAMQAAFLSAGGRVQWVETTAEICRAKFTHPEFAPDGVEVAVTMQELTDSGLTQGKGGMKENYRKFPRQMLRARVISEAIRMIMPQIVAGVYTLEEVGDVHVIDHAAAPVPMLSIADADTPPPAPPTEQAQRIALANTLADTISEEDFALALRYLRSFGNLTADQGIEDLPVEILKRAVANPDKLTAAAADWAAKQEAGHD